MTIKAIIFDLDGTLRDTRDVIYKAVKHAVKEHGGGDLSDEDLADYMQHHSYAHQHFVSHVSLAEFERVFHGKLFELLPTVELYEHAVQVLAGLHASGYLLGIVSSAGSAEIDSFLERMGIAKYFSSIAGDDGQMARKPSPEPLRYVLKRLGVTVQECAMVGDMRVDMQAAAAANVPVKIGITHGFEDEESLRAAGADYIIDSLMVLPELISSIK